MTDKEITWKMKRCGNITSSAVGRLMVDGRRDMTPEELAAAKELKVRRKTVDVMWGDSAVSYLYQVAREIRLKKPCRSITTKEMQWGHDKEIEAIRWFNKNYFHNLKSCSEDYEDIIFKDDVIPGYGDSPDGYEYNSDGKLIALAEVKCFAMEAKIESIREMSAKEAIKEYYWQLMSHFLSHPGVDVLYYIVYDGQDEEDELDYLDPLDESRGIYFTLHREDYLDDIKRLEEKVIYATFYLFLNSISKVTFPIRDINRCTFALEEIGVSMSKGDEKFLLLYESEVPGVLKKFKCSDIYSLMDYMLEEYDVSIFVRPNE